MKKKLYIALYAIFASTQFVYPQITTNEQPISIQRGLDNLVKGLPVNGFVPNLKKVLREDSILQEMNPNGLRRTAVPIATSLDMNREGIWTNLNDGGKICQLEICADKALALDFVFSKFWLPQGGKFFIFNPSTKESIGAITSKYISGDKLKPHRFSTGIIRGDKMVLEYYQPKEVKEQPVIIIERVYYTYIPAPNFNSSCDSEVNVNCSEGSNWQLEKNAVALVYCKFNHGSGWCSGSLVNTVYSSYTPLFLTADHCLELKNANNITIERKDAEGNNNLSDWVFYWGYEMASCSGYTQPSYNRTTVGATILANNQDSDFALLQLEQDPINLSDYVPYYLGWDASGDTGVGGVCIHHPNGDVKKISTYDCTPLSANSKLWGVQWIQTTNGHGITEGGSSGSPLINNHRRVIGQLSKGNTNCSNLTATDYYGKLSVSWTGNGSSDSCRRLKDWLDPTNSGFTFSVGKSPLSLNGPYYVCCNSIATYTINNLPSSFTVNWYFTDGFGPAAPTLQTSSNTCTINNNLSSSYMGILHADIYYQGNLMKSLQQQVVVYAGFYATYSINHGVSQQLTTSNSVIWVNYGDLVEIRSPNFVTKNISYSIVTPYLWHYDDYTFSGDLDVGFPSSAGHLPVVISVQNNTNYSNCDTSHQILLMPTSVLPQPQLNATGGNGTINVELITEMNEEALKLLQDLPVSIQIDDAPTWTLEVIDAKKGDKILTKEITGTSTSVALPGKSTGIFLVRATIGEKTLSEKVIVK